MNFRGYINNLFQFIPDYIIWGLLFFLLIGVAFVLIIKGFRRGLRLISGIFLATYFLLLYFSTIVFRIYRENQGYNFIPFWSYKTVFAGNEHLLYEIIMNELVFIPVGLLLGMTFRFIKWWHVLLAGTLISVSIEVLQYFLKRGFAEFDDVFHNVLGCMIGFSIYKIVMWIAAALFPKKIKINA